MNCQWIEPKLEAFFTDSLSDEAMEACRVHLAACEACRRQVESLRNVDTLIRRVMHRRIALAQRGKPAPLGMRGWKAAVVGAGFAAIVVLLGAGLILMQETPAPPVAIQTLPQTPGPEEITNKKKDEGGGSGIGRAKPEDDLPAATAVEPDLDLPANDGPDFAITDPVGYTVNLDFYRGRAFLFAVVSPDQNAAVANLEEIYSAFGSNPGIRILGVARQREDRFEGVRFPLYFNQGSKLLGVRDGEFLLLDKSGKEQLEGSLADSRNLTRIRSQLARLGIQQP